MNRLIIPATPSPLNRLRYVKNKSLGMTVEEIAQAEGVGIAVVRKSISTVEAYHGLFTIKEMEAGQNEVIMLNQQLEALALQRGLTAETLIRDKNGKVIDREPNHEVQQRSVELIVKLVEAVKSQKGSGSQRMNVNLGVVAGGNTQAAAGAQSFEDRLRVIQKSRGELTVATATPVATKTVDSEDVTDVTPNWTDEDEEAERESEASEGDSA